MTRAGLEFSDKTRDEAAKRANGRCEYCHLPFRGRPEFHHILAAAFGGRPTLANCMVICKTPCHKELTGRGTRQIRKADRQRKAHNGAKRSKHPIRNRKTERKARQIDKLPLPPRRGLYESKGMTNDHRTIENMTEALVVAAEIERVAKAIYEAQMSWCLKPRAWEKLEQYQRDGTMPLAIAAIKAVREPPLSHRLDQARVIIRSSTELGMTREQEALRDQAIAAMKAAGVARWIGKNWPTDRTIWDAMFQDAFDALHGVVRVVPPEATEDILRNFSTAEISLFQFMTAAGNLTKPPK
jgi:5-methylcytosine-specific restriction protein A